MDRLPCGCLMGSIDDTFVFEACSPTCKYYLYVMEQIEAQQKDYTHIDLRDSND